MKSYGLLTILCLAGGLALSACSSGALRAPAPDQAKALAAEAAAAQQLEAAASERPARRGARRPWEPVRKLQALAYCVSSQLNTPEDLLVLAQADCKGGTLAFYGQDNGIRYCPLFQPHRLTFICYPPAATAEESE